MERFLISTERGIISVKLVSLLSWVTDGDLERRRHIDRMGKIRYGFQWGANIMAWLGCGEPNLYTLLDGVQGWLVVQPVRRSSFPSVTIDSPCIQVFLGLSCPQDACTSSHAICFLKSPSIF